MQHPIKDNQALVIWLCGLAGSGKSTIGLCLYQKIKNVIPNVVYLDGDELRELLGHYGYDRESRVDMALKRSRFAHFLSTQGIVVIVTTISMFNEIYIYNRKTLNNYLEVFIECELDELKRRDQKGLYSGAFKGEISNVVGVDIPFDVPLPMLTLHNTQRDSLEDNVQKIFDCIDFREV